MLSSRAPGGSGGAATQDAQAKALFVAQQSLQPLLNIWPKDQVLMQPKLNIWVLKGESMHLQE